MDLKNLSNATLASMIGDMAKQIEMISNANGAMYSAIVKHKEDQDNEELWKLIPTEE